MVSSVQQRHRSVGVRPKEGHRNDPWNRKPLKRRQTERDGTVQPGEEKAFQYLKGTIGKKMTDSLAGSVMIGHGKIVSN